MSKVTAGVVRDIFDDIEKVLEHYSDVVEKDNSEYGELILTDIVCAIGKVRDKYLEDAKMDEVIEKRLWEIFGAQV